MLSKVMEKEINNQINEELFSAYIYLSMSAWFERQNLGGFANWMYIQYQEELTHAMKFFKYMNEVGGKVALQKIEKPREDWGNPVLAFEETLKHEQHITKRINKLVALAKKENDYATENFLQWYVDEQVEEEKNASEILGHLKMIEKSKAALLMLDQKLASRTFVDETK